MLKEILPDYLKKVKIEHRKERLMSYSPNKNVIYINKKALLGIKEHKTLTERYLNRKLSNKHFIIFCLLHELGHKNNFIFGKDNNDLYEKQGIEAEMIEDYRERNFTYWNNVIEERSAMDFAKEYYFKYIIRETARRLR